MTCWDETGQNSQRRPSTRAWFRNAWHVASGHKDFSWASFFSKEHCDAFCSAVGNTGEVFDTVGPLHSIPCFMYDPGQVPTSLQYSLTFLHGLKVSWLECWRVAIAILIMTTQGGKVFCTWLIGIALISPAQRSTTTNKSYFLSPRWKAFMWYRKIMDLAEMERVAFPLQAATARSKEMSAKCIQSRLLCCKRHGGYVWLCLATSKCCFVIT